VSQLARKHVTVLLSGEGGDEAFAGYQTYRTVFWLERLRRRLGPLAGLTGRLMMLAKTAEGSGRLRKYGVLMATSMPEYYYSHSSTPETHFNRSYEQLYTLDFSAAIGDSRRSGPSEHYFSDVQHLSPLDQMLYVDTNTWLPNDLLVKADKMTMANSLELRVPLLDHHILEFAASLPPQYKVKNTCTKHILKEALSKRLPSEILSRKKTGFPVPYAKWLSEDLRSDVAGVLLDNTSVARGYFRQDTVEKMIFNDDGNDFSKELFSLTTLEMWHRVFVDRTPSYV
jgi:asparagine synthase (glutamine-hydrolysing)